MCLEYFKLGKVVAKAQIQKNCKKRNCSFIAEYPFDQSAWKVTADGVKCQCWDC